MGVAVLVDLPVKPEALNELKATMKQILPDTRAFKGCKSIDVYSNKDESNLVLYELWESREDHQKYMAWRQETGALEQLGKALTGAPSIRYFDRVDA